MSVSRDTLDRIKAALDPLALVREAVPGLQQAGARWKGLCPFHNERSPSFFFQPDKGLWHCFGACQEGGDIIRFVMKLESLTFPEAVRELARRTGIPLEPERGGDEADRRARERDLLLDLLDQAARFYRDALRSGAEAEPARRLLAQRGVRPESMDRFQLGYASRREGFLERALKNGVAIEPLLKSGLAVRSDRTGRYQDLLAGRLIFPIRSAFGRVVGFGGRVLGDDGGPKYINSPDTPVYTKGHHLYGLFEGGADIRAAGQAVVVEGYMDVVGLHQSACGRAVAPLGTALTAEQARLLRRYALEAVLLFDPDPAGQKASWRGADVLLREDVFVRVAQVPGGLDPDEYVKDHGPDALKKALAGAQDVVDFWLDMLAPALEGLSDLHGRLRRAEELLRFVRGVPHELWRAEWIKKIAGRLRLDAAALAREGRPPARARPAPPPAPAPVRTAEEEVLQVLGAHPDAWVDVDEHLFEDTRCLAVYRHWRAQRAGQGALSPADAVDALGAADRSWLTALLLEGKQFADPRGSLERGVARLEQSALRRERRALERDVQDMSRGVRPRDEHILARYHTLTRALKASAPTAPGPHGDR